MKRSRLVTVVALLLCLNVGVSLWMWGNSRSRQQPPRPAAQPVASARGNENPHPLPPLGYKSHATPFTPPASEFDWPFERQVLPENSPSVTFNQDIGPIIYAHCTECHRKGQVGRLPLASYQDVRKQARNVAEVTRKRFMPPWKIVPGYGDFEGEMRLSDEEIAKIGVWARHGTPEGEPPAPTLPVFTDQWSVGPPDKVVDMDATYTVPADGKADYRAIVLPLHNKDTLYVRGADCMTDNRTVTHHVDILTDSTGEGLMRQSASNGVGYESFGGAGFVCDAFIGALAPGTRPTLAPPDTGFELKPNTSIVLLAHFTPTGKPEKVKLSVGLYLCPQKPVHKYFSLSFETHAVDIPAGAARHAVRWSQEVPCDAYLLSMVPHAHMLGHEMKVVAVYPNGRPKPLLWLRDWDFNLQRAYVFKAPVLVQGGTRLDFEYFYDNSAANPNNPNTPPKRVRWGESTYDEMADCHVQLSPTTPQEAELLERVLVNTTKERLDEGYHGEKGGFQNRDR